jgi:non-canonical poly(A) RNA polymerase PAPD5/7
MCLQDPADSTNDLGRKGLCIKHVQATLAEVCKGLKTACDQNTKHSLLECIVGDIYWMNRQARGRLVSYGLDVSHQDDIILTARKIRKETSTTGAASPQVLSPS